MSKTLSASLFHQGRRFRYTYSRNHQSQAAFRRILGYDQSQGSSLSQLMFKRTLVALHDDPDLGADALVDELLS